MQPGEFKFPDVSSPLSKILARNRGGSTRGGSGGSSSDVESPLSLHQTFGGLGSPGSNYYRNSGYSSDGSNGGGGGSPAMEDSVAHHGLGGVGKFDFAMGGGTGGGPGGNGHSSRRSESPQSESGYGTSYGSAVGTSAAVGGGAGSGGYSSDEGLNDLLVSCFPFLVVIDPYLIS